MDASSDAWLALAGTILGGVGLEVIRRALSKTKEREDFATQIRTELRADLTAIRAEVDALEKEVTQWKDRYYELWERYILMEAEQTTVKKKPSDTS